MKIKIDVLNWHDGHEPDGDRKIDIRITKQAVLAGPASIYREESTQEQMSKYDEWLEDQITGGNQEVIAALDDIAAKAVTEEGVALICYCAPQVCHGHGIKRVVIDALKAAAGYEYVPENTRRANERRAQQ